MKKITLVYVGGFILWALTIWLVPHKHHFASLGWFAPLFAFGISIFLSLFLHEIFDATHSEIKIVITVLCGVVFGLGSWIMVDVFWAWNAFVSFVFTGSILPVSHHWCDQFHSFIRRRAL